MLEAAFAFPGSVPEEVTPTIEKIVIGHPICLSGKYAEAGVQAFGGIQAIVEWVNDVHGGVEVSWGKGPAGVQVLRL